MLLITIIAGIPLIVVFTPLGISTLHPRLAPLGSWIPRPLRSVPRLFYSWMTIVFFNDSPDNQRGVHKYARDGARFFMLAGLIGSLIRVFGILAKHSRIFRAKILLMSENTESSNPRRSVDGTLTADEEDSLLMSIFSWTVFLVNMIITPVWYGVIYDPEGTSTPTWTGVFA